MINDMNHWATPAHCAELRSKQTKKYIFHQFCPCVEVDNVVGKEIIDIFIRWTLKKNKTKLAKLCAIYVQP